MRLADRVVMRIKHLAEDFGPPPVATDEALLALDAPTPPIDPSGNPELADALVTKGLKLPAG